MLSPCMLMIGKFGVHVSKNDAPCFPLLSLFAGWRKEEKTVLQNLCKGNKHTRNWTLQFTTVSWLQLVLGQAPCWAKEICGVDSFHFSLLSDSSYVSFLVARDYCGKILFSPTVTPKKGIAPISLVTEKLDNILSMHHACNYQRQEM